MITGTIGVPAGFQVVHESTGWRIAYHAYDEKVNSLSILKNWGMHLDSEEAFFLLSGELWLAVAGTRENPKPVQIQKLQPGKMYCVEAGEKHAVVLKEGAVVLIAENRDMSNSVVEEISRADLKAIQEACHAGE